MLLTKPPTLYALTKPQTQQVVINYRSRLLWNLCVKKKKEPLTELSEQSRSTEAVGGGLGDFGKKSHCVLRCAPRTALCAQDKGFFSIFIFLFFFKKEEYEALLAEARRETRQCFFNDTHTDTQTHSQTHTHTHTGLLCAERRVSASLTTHTKTHTDTEAFYAHRGA
jgi:hypothetical protein